MGAALAFSRPEVSPDADEMRSTPPTRRARVLVVEDEVVVARHIVATLARSGFETVGRATTGEDAIRLAHELEPDLIVADIHLRGDLDGVDTVAHIRGERETSVVFLTAYADDETVTRAMATGPSGYVVKPFSEPSLRCAIEVALSRREREQEVVAAATYDELTGAFTRRAFRTMAEHQLKLSHRHRLSTAILFLDLDGLKEINDYLGHEHGDAAIREMTAVLKRTVRESDLVARLGGDEFVVLAADCSVLGAEQLKQRIVSAVQARNAEGGLPFKLATSVGVAVSDAGVSEALDSLVARADAAMYADKRRRKETRAV